MIALRGIHHVALRVRDVDEAATRWSRELGLVVRERTTTRARLACNVEPYALELLAGDVPGYDHAAYELAAGLSLEDAARHLDGLGVHHEQVDGALALEDPDGQAIHLHAHEPAADSSPAVTRLDATLPGLGMRRLGHVNSTTADIPAMTSFYTEALGMRVSDLLEDDGGVWLNCGRDHHVNALVGTGTRHFHHLAFELVDWSDLRVALDHLSHQGRWCPWGPVRHSVGQNIAAYARIPEEDCFVELYCDMELLEDDHVARLWADDRRSSNLWGLLPPRTYFRFDDEAIEAERTSSVMYDPLPWLARDAS